MECSKALDCIWENNYCIHPYLLFSSSPGSNLENEVIRHSKQDHLKLVYDVLIVVLKPLFGDRTNVSGWFRGKQCINKISRCIIPSVAILHTSPRLSTCLVFWIVSRVAETVMAVLVAPRYSKNHPNGNKRCLRNTKAYLAKHKALLDEASRLESIGRNNMQQSRRKELLHLCVKIGSSSMILCFLFFHF